MAVLMPASKGRAIPFQPQEEPASIPMFSHELVFWVVLDGSAPIAPEVPWSLLSAIHSWCNAASRVCCILSLDL